eukprot:5684512-Amphidinium_carterae.1
MACMACSCIAAQQRTHTNTHLDLLFYVVRAPLLNERAAAMQWILSYCVKSAKLEEIKPGVLMGTQYPCSPSSA